jgi:hypothetical protein
VFPRSVQHRFRPDSTAATRTSCRSPTPFASLPETAGRFAYCNCTVADNPTFVQTGVLQLREIFYCHEVLKPWVNAVDPADAKRKRKFIVRRDPRDISVIYFYDPDWRSGMTEPDPLNDRLIQIVRIDLVIDIRTLDCCLSTWPLFSRPSAAGRPQSSLPGSIHSVS